MANVTLPPPFPPCPWANSSRHLEGCLHLQIMLFKRKFLALAAVLLSHFKIYELSAALQTSDNCSSFPHSSADLHSHCKDPKPIYLSLVCGLWLVLVAFVEGWVCMYMGGCGRWGGWCLHIGRAEDRNVDCQMSRERPISLVSLQISRTFISFYFLVTVKHC